MTASMRASSNAVGHPPRRRRALPCDLRQRVPNRLDVQQNRRALRRHLVPAGGALEHGTIEHRLNGLCDLAVAFGAGDGDRCVVVHSGS